MNLLPNKRLAALVLACAFAELSSCSSQAPTPLPRTAVRFTTGLPGMTFKPLGEAIAGVYRGVLPDIDISVIETAGSVSNIDQLQKGTADLGLALADVAYMAFNGQIPELTGSAKDVRGIAVLHPSVLHVLVGRYSKVRTVADLRGGRIGIGPPGSGTAVTSALLLRAYGVNASDVQLRTALFLDSTDALVRGDLDAVFIVSADPGDAVRRATQAGARLLDVEGTTIERLRGEYPFLRPTVIAGGTYPGHPGTVRTLRIDVLLLCRASLDDGVVHRMTSALFEALPTLSEQLGYLRLMDVRRAPATPIPLHPGAALYYREQELAR